MLCERFVVYKNLFLVMAFRIEVVTTSMLRSDKLNMSSFLSWPFLQLGKFQINNDLVGRGWPVLIWYLSAIDELSFWEIIQVLLLVLYFSLRRAIL